MRTYNISNDEIPKSKKAGTEFVRQHSDELDIESIVLDESLSCRYQIAMEYSRVIDWTLVAVCVAYRTDQKPEPIITKEREKTMRMLRKHSDMIDWEFISSYNADYHNPDFFKLFIEKIKWGNFIRSRRERISHELIESASLAALIDWEAVSSFHPLPYHFVEDNREHINWEVFLQNHSFQEIPQSCQNKENILIAARNNPDILSIVADKQLYAEAAETLKRFNWIDRTAGKKNHYADDSGTWIDGIGLNDDQCSLESDLWQYRLSEQEQTVDTDEPGAVYF